MGEDCMMAQQYMILGKDTADAEAQRDKWLSQHPEVKIVRLHPPKPESSSLLARFGGANVLRVSIVVEYEESRHVSSISLAVSPAAEQSGDGGHDHRAHERISTKLPTRKSTVDMEDVTKHSSN
jgi:hypothetical protein